MNYYEANPDPGGHKICAAISNRLNPPPPKKLHGNKRGPPGAQFSFVGAQHAVPGARPWRDAEHPAIGSSGFAHGPTPPRKFAGRSMLRPYNPTARDGFLFAGADAWRDVAHRSVAPFASDDVQCAGNHRRRRGRYFGVVKIGRLAIFSSCAVGCFFFGFLVSRLFLSLFPIPGLCHGPPALARGRSAWSLDRLDATE